MENPAKIICIICLIGLIFSGCAKKTNVGAIHELPLQEPPQETVSQQVSSFTLSSVGGDDSSRWRIDAESADIMDETIELKNARIESPEGNIVSKKMVVFFEPGKKNLQRVEATGDVHFTKGNSFSTSEKAVYFAKDGRISLTGNPVIYLDADEVRQAERQ